MGLVVATSVRLPGDIAELGLKSVLKRMGLLPQSIEKSIGVICPNLKPSALNPAIQKPLNPKP